MRSSRYLALSLALTSALACLDCLDCTTLSAMGQVLHREISVNEGAPAQSQPRAVAYLGGAFSRPARSPAALIDDLIEVTVHSQDPAVRQDILHPGDDHHADAVKHGPASLQHSIPDVININYRPARAAAQVYLGHNSQDAAAHELDEAKFRDQITVMVTAIMLELATGLGDDNKETITLAKDKLARLVGNGETEWAFIRLQKFSQTLPPKSNAFCPESGKFEKSWDVLGQEALANRIASRAIGRDQAVSNLKARLGVREKPPDQFEKSLSLLSMIPEVVATAALVGDQILEMSNGGTREKRLGDVLSYGLQLDSRQNALTRQSYLVASSLNAAKLSKNDVLAGFAQALAQTLSGEQN